MVNHPHAYRIYRSLHRNESCGPQRTSGVYCVVPYRWRWSMPRVFPMLLLWSVTHTAVTPIMMQSIACLWFVSSGWWPSSAASAMLTLRRVLIQPSDHNSAQFAGRRMAGRSSGFFEYQGLGIGFVWIGYRSSWVLGLHGHSAFECIGGLF